ncbi:MAG: hypothetical protein P4L98_15490 [Ancalomicrobiaceae bacterium]|nr:hypothetical protein [Ancalomicrobiaceae bacterium]
MTDRLTSRFLPRFGGLTFVVALAACSSTGFVDEDADKQVPEDNLAKNVLIASGAIDDPNARPMQYSPRAPLMVPPKRTLPQPVDADAKLASTKFPVNPEDADLKRRLAVGDDTVGQRVMTPDEQKKYKNLPTSGPGTPGTTIAPSNQHDASLPLKPWELDGKAQQQALAEADKTSPRRKQDALITPPEAYRTPSAKAPMQAEEQSSWKPSWWPF